MYLLGDKIRLMKPMGDLKTVGMAYEIGGIHGENVVIRNAVSKVAIAVIPVIEIQKYFEPIRTASWTEWQPLKDGNDIIGYYKTNGKRVTVKANGFKSDSSCHHEDVFNLALGIRLAYLRCNKKYAESMRKRFEMMETITNEDIRNVIKYTNR